MAQRNEYNDFESGRPNGRSSHRSGYGYQQDMPQRNDFGGHRGQNEFEEQRQFRGMNQEQWQEFQQPQTYRMDFDRNRESYRPIGSRSERPGRSFANRGNSVYDRDNYSTTEDMGFRSASSDMPSADRYRTRGADDDGPGLYGGAEDYGHAGYQERFDYGANRYPNPDMARFNSSRPSYAGMNRSQSNFGGSTIGAGPHRGKGPKNYSRSDDRIREDVCECLMQDSDIDASEIDVKVSSGEVTLNGSVDNKDQKRRAEDLIEQLAGVKDVRNELHVESSSDQNSPLSASDRNGQSSSRSNSSRSTTRVS